MNLGNHYSVKQFRLKIAGAFLVFLCCLGLMFGDISTVSAGLFSDGLAELSDVGQTVALAIKKAVSSPASIIDSIKCFFGFDCPREPAESYVATDGAADKITKVTTIQEGPKPSQNGEVDEPAKNNAALAVDPGAMPPVTGIYRNSITLNPDLTPALTPKLDALAGAGHLFEMTFEAPIQIPAENIVTYVNTITNTVIVDEETKNKVNLILRQLDSDRPSYSLGSTYHLPDDIRVKTIDVNSGKFTVDKHGNISTVGDFEITGNFTVTGAQTFSGAAALNAATAIPLFSIEQGGTGAALEADNITLKGSTIATSDSDTGLLINPNGTGAVQFHSASNFIDSTGSLVLDGDITLTSGGTFYTTGNGNLVFAPNGTGNLVVGETGNTAKIVPFEDSTAGYDLGALTARWFDIYAKGKLDIDSTTLTASQLSFIDTGRITTGASKDLTLQAGAAGKTRVTDGTDYVDIADGTQALYAVKGANAVKLANGTYAVDATGDVRLSGDITVNGGKIIFDGGNESIDNETAHLLKLATSGDAQVVLGDAAGVNQFQIKDSNGNTVASIDSDGKATLANAAITGSLGIGTADPQEALDVNGRVKLAQTTAPADTADKLYNVSGNLLWNGVNLTAAGGLPVGTEGQTLYNNAGVWTANSGLFYDDTTGNVGIGTTAPGSLLELRAINTLDNVISINDTGGNNLFYIAPDSVNHRTKGRLIDPNTDGEAELTLTAGTSRSFVMSAFGENAAGTTVGISNANLGIFEAGSNISNLVFYTKKATAPVIFGTNSIERLRIDSSGNVGIGTTAPQSQLEVSSNANTQLFISGYHVINSPQLYFHRARGTNDVPTALQTNDRIGIIGFSGYDGTQFVTPGAAITGKAAEIYTSSARGSYLTLETALIGSTVRAERMRIADSGNVGIGTTSPSHKLDVVQTGTTTGLAAIKGLNSGINVGTAYGVYGTATGASVTNVGGYFSASGATNNYGLIVESGNVGIGTTAPTRKLTVDNGTAAGTIFVAQTNADGGDAAFSINNIYNAAGSLDETVSSVWKFNDITAATMTIGKESDFSSVGNRSSYLQIATRNAGATTNALRITSSGNVGIGTTGPASRLHVVGADTSASIVAQIGGLTGTGLVVLNNGYVGIGTATPGKALDVVGTGRFSGGLIASGAGISSIMGNLGIGMTDPVAKLHVIGSDSLATSFAANISGATGTGLVVLNSGNVGIGTTGPAYKLQVLTVGSAASTEYIVGNFGESITTKGIQWGYATDGSGAVVEGRLRSAGSGTNLALGTVGNRQAIYVLDSAGNVGIGTTAPSYKLDVAGTLNASATSTFAGRVGIGTTAPSKTLDVVGDIQSSSNIYTTYTTFSGYYSPRLTGTDTIFRNYTGSEQMRILDSGNVGIGTTGPASELHINSTATTEKSILRIFAPSMANGQGASIFLGKSAATDAAATMTFYPQATAANSYLAIGMFGTAGPLNITKGNVGIGTTAPGAKLEVNGVSRFDNSSQWYSGATHYGTITYGGGIDAFNVIAANGKQLTFGSNGVYDRMVLDSAGNVGIGTTGPVSNLDVRAVDGAKVVIGTNGVGGSYGTPKYMRLDFVGYDYVNSGAMGRIEVRDRATDASYSDINFLARNSSSVLSSLMYLDGNQGNVGIGTTAPGAKLTIVSDAGASGLWFWDAAQQDRISVMADSPSDGIGSIYNLRPGTPNTFQKLQLGSSAAGQGLLVDGSTGNVGIGTTGPGAVLEVKGTAGGTETLFQIKNSANNVAFTIDNSQLQAIFHSGSASFPSLVMGGGTNSNTGFFQAAVDQVGVSINGAEKVRIDSTGNVGIGTTGPAGLLAVGGAGSSNYVISGIGTTNGGVYGLAPTNGNAIYGNTATGRGVYGHAATGVGGVFSSDSGYGLIVDSGNVGIGTTAPSAKLSVLGSDSLATTTVANLSGATGTGLVVMADGKVGIGTTAPTVALDVVGAIKASSYFTGNGTAINGTYGMYYSAAAKGAYGFGAVTGTGAYPLSLTAGDAATYTDSNISFSTSGLERMRILSSGNVGIGTTAPLVKLDVVNEAATTNTVLPVIGLQRLTTGTAANGIGARLEFFTEDSIGETKLTSYIDSAFDDVVNRYASLRFQTRNGASLSEAMRIDNLGNVGIGTTGPLSRLYVAGPSQDVGTYGIMNFDTNTGTNDVGIKFGAIAGAGTVGYAFIQAKHVGVNNDGNLSLNPTSGNVGIGTTGPLFKLDVNGTLNASATSTFAGRVGIGTTAPAYSLDVVGNIKASSYGVFGTGSTVVGNGVFSLYQNDLNNGYIGFPSAGNIALMNGNVGIGTTGPDNILTLRGVSPQVDIQSTDDAQTPGIWMRYQNAATSGTKIYYSTSAATTYLDNLYPYSVGTNYGSFDIRTKNSGNNLTSRFYVKGDSGNVGIGTTNPTAALDVTLDIKSSRDVYSVGHYVGATGLMGSSSGNGLKFGTRDAGGYSVQMFLQSTTGNVGIGTTGPAAKLQVAGTTFLNGGLDVGDTAYYDSTVAFSVKSNRTFIFNMYDASANPLMFLSQAGNLLLQRGTLTVSGTGNSSIAGNVGIGTTNPLSKLHSKESGAKTAVNYAGYLENIATNTTTDAINKYGAYITSTGDFSGSGGTATNNYGLYIDTVSGGDNNYGLAVKTVPTTANSANMYYDSATGVIYYNASSEKYKKDIQPLQSDYSKILSVSAKQWTYSSDNSLGIGFVAEDLEKLGLNELVIYNSAGQPDGIQFNRVAAYMLEAMKGQQKEIDVLSLAIGSNGVIGNASSTAAFAEASASQGIIDWLKNGLESLGMGLKDGVASLKEVVADRFAAKELQMIDKATGEKYCTWIENGEWVKVKGECGAAPEATDNSSDSNENDSSNSSGSNTSNSGSDSGGSNGSSGEGTATSTPEE